MIVKIKVLEGGKKPEYKRMGDACLDCYARIACKIVTISKGTRALIPLGFMLELPANYEAVVRPRSGLTSKYIDVAIGTCDENYRGELMANVINNSGEDFVISNGDRICQLAIRQAPTVYFEVVDKLSETNRGDSGFGSSGI